MINNTTMCRCGGEKEKKIQWCGLCWGALTTRAQGDYIRSVGLLQAAIKAGNLDLDIDQKMEEQPCL